RFFRLFFSIFIFLFPQSPLHHSHLHHLHCLINILRLRFSLLLFKATNTINLFSPRSASLQTQPPRCPFSFLRWVSIRLPIQSPNTPHFSFDR
ncbi:hypothetical protein VIGAN_07193000, partial [Vigna angularis var. angularis]